MIKKNMKTKAIYKSKTIQSLLPILVVLLGKYFDIYVAEEEVMTVIESIAIITTTVGVVIGRYKAEDKLTIK